MVHLPERFEFKTIRCMKPGQTVFVAPWGMVVDLQGYCYVSLDIATNPTQEFNYRMKIQRTDQGFTVYCSEFVEQTPHKWKRSDLDLSSGMFAPVFEIV